MAGDWIKVETVTPDKPEIYQIAEALEIDPDAVSGKLIRIWIWADQQTIDGNAPGVTKMLIDRLAGVAGFADAMLTTGWLTTGSGGLAFTNFDRHNGKGAKKRAVTNRRVSNHRQKVTPEKRNGNGESNAGSVTESVTREEKRRDKESKKKFSPPSVQEVADYCNERGNGIDPQNFVDHYAANGWKRGNTPIKDWQACVRTWESKRRQAHTNEQQKSGRLEI